MKKRAKRWREEFEWKISLFEIDFPFGINAFDLDKGTDVMKDTWKKRMDANVPDEIDGAKGEQVPNHVVKKEIKHCKRWYWNDPELENKWYRTQLYEMHLLLNPSQREELENELTSREELVILQVEFVDMEDRMQELMEEFKKSQKMLSYGNQLQ
uniref:Uncharacterized protein n=1 Tax=Tanacetum cinerariifolium TaxID=118510 RepID=A0A699H6R6_TANCI|nr:hypothetical protein [Tanacetum cinerariifolium]